jgi:DNA-binding GntR family transcriptional regulator
MSLKRLGCRNKWAAPDEFAPVRATAKQWADDRPIAVAKTPLSPALFQHARPPSAAELDAGSLYTWIENHTGVRIASSSEAIEAAPASP